MAARHVVVDGSNLATEGRSMPSLAQLDQAVREFLTENPEDVVTVVVDASFGHRIDSSESMMFEEAEEAGELVSPPAGAIGRGDAFLLRIADKTGATVLSNDSFQEFHGDYDWLFERGRLIGGKPVPGVGWIFTPRTPVRGPRSREAVKEAKRKTTKEPESTKPGLDLAAERSRAKGQGKGKRNVERAIAVALEEAVAPKDKPHRRRKGGSPPADAVNNPLAFITFIAAHPLGAEVTATVESFASHGAFVDCEGARCYVPLSAMGNPPPKSAREIFTKGQEITFVVQALDPQRRGVELAIPGFAKIAGAPTDETVAAEIGGQAEEEAEALATPAPLPTARRTRKKAAPAPAEAGSEPPPSAPVKRAAPRRRTSRVAPVSSDGSVEVGAEVAAAAGPAAVASMQAAPQQTAAPGARTPRRRGSPVTPAGSVEVAPQPAAVQEAAVVDEAAPVGRVPRRRAPRAALEQSPDPVAVPESATGSVSAADTDAASDAGPAARPRRRGVPQVRAAGPAETPPATPGQPAARARRRGASAASEAGSAGAEAEAKTEAPAPARARRRGAPEVAAALEVAPAEAGPAVPARARRRGAPQAPPAEPVADGAGGRRRRAPAVPATEPDQAAAEPGPAPSAPKRRRAQAPADESGPPVAPAPRPRSRQGPPGEPASTDSPADPPPRRRTRARDADGD